MNSSVSGSASIQLLNQPVHRAFILCMNSSVSGSASIQLLNQPVHRLCCHLCCNVPVKGARPAALLHVTKDVASYREFVLSFFTVQPVEEISAVVLTGIFIPQD